jgi:hypothetical protein
MYDLVCICALKVPHTFFLPLHFSYHFGCAGFELRDSHLQDIYCTFSATNQACLVLGFSELWYPELFA